MCTCQRSKEYIEMYDQLSNPTNSDKRRAARDTIVEYHEIPFQRTKRRQTDVPLDNSPAYLFPPNGNANSKWVPEAGSVLDISFSTSSPATTLPRDPLEWSISNWAPVANSNSASESDTDSLATVVGPSSPIMPSTSISERNTSHSGTLQSYTATDSYFESRSDFDDDSDTDSADTIIAPPPSPINATIAELRSQWKSVPVESRLNPRARSFIHKTSYAGTCACSCLASASTSTSASTPFNGGSFGPLILPEPQVSPSSSARTPSPSTQSTSNHTPSSSISTTISSSSNSSVSSSSTHPRYSSQKPQYCPRTGQRLHALSRTYSKPEKEIDIAEALARGPLPGRFYTPRAPREQGEQERREEFEKVKRDLRGW
ncbi:uncharacterized protein RCO7_14296 [Rhynchosporium graminicola]|uniref:Uncharacterized protein n=1 Tax=Rhynchosporium graminicola TaxID=2792576 RepID=A0A1E1K7H1_9HELO|nr:uncharacterized protein RCO7_14296 [Rhynchosporium commune]